MPIRYGNKTEPACYTKPSPIPRTKKGRRRATKSTHPRQGPRGFSSEQHARHVASKCDGLRGWAAHDDLKRRGVKSPKDPEK